MMLVAEITSNCLNTTSVHMFRAQDITLGSGKIMLRIFYWIPCSEETFRIKYTDRHVLKPSGADEI